MIKHTILHLIAVASFTNCLAGQGQPSPTPPAGKIVVQIEIPATHKNDRVKFVITPANYMGNRPDNDTLLVAAKDGHFKFTIDKNGPVHVSSLFGSELMESNDSVHISFVNDQPVYSGRGAAKFRMSELIQAKYAALAEPSQSPLLASLAEFHAWNRYYDERVAIRQVIIEQYKDSLSPYAYDYYQATVSSIERVRLNKFNVLCQYAEKLGVSKADLIVIYDSIYALPQNKWLRSLTKKRGNISYFASVVQMALVREYGFDRTHPALANSQIIKKGWYQLASKLYNGALCENYLAFLITEEMIQKYGFTPQVEAMLSDFYSRPGYPEYKAYVRQFEQAKRSQYLNANTPVPDFILRDKNGKQFTPADFKGKIVVLYFHNDRSNKTGADILNALREKTSNDSSILFIDLLEGNVNNQSMPERVVRLYTDSIVARKFYMQAYPSVYIWSEWGRFLSRPFEKPGEQDVEHILPVIRQRQTKMKDGPYVFYNSLNPIAYSLYGAAVTTQPGHQPLSAVTDEYGKHFSIALKTKHLPEPSVYTQPEKLLALSDIEGNFDAFRKLLQANNVIDDQFNWIFGKGHLVFAGDMFDRGEQVTECLWLIYSLEEKAKAAGGYVHFIMGNHEIMNLSGDLRYVKDKYLDAAKHLHRSYVQLYGTDTELGRWLRSKNIVEKIGNLLFAHGGISVEVASLPLSLEQINQLSRSYYDKSNEAANSPDTALRYLFNSRVSPFWHRSYYHDEEMKVTIGRRGLDTMYKVPAARLDDILKRFDVAKIVTGHTVVARTITMHYEGKVINTDTRHAYGYSEALLVLDNVYYRVDTSGKKIPLSVAAVPPNKENTD